MVLVRECTEQRAIADHVDDSWHATREPVNFPERGGRERLGGGARHAHAVLDVTPRFLGGERVEVIPGGDALRELAQFRPREQITQLGLPDQDDLQQLGRRRLEIGEQPHLFERVRAQVLRLVDDQHDAPSARVRVQQSAADQVHQQLDAAAPGLGYRDPQLLADG